MRCPQCVDEGERSRVTSGGTMSTLMSFQDFYDEDGEPHHHDRNEHSTEYRCSRGHAFARLWKPKCPSCDFNEGADRIVAVSHPAGDPE